MGGSMGLDMLYQMTILSKFHVNHESSSNGKTLLNSQHMHVSQKSSSYGNTLLTSALTPWHVKYESSWHGNTLALAQ